ncbi:androgen-induced gene 1 protein-like [Leguminivora glycinivorella]|uniref:androgen-induced gene 1 protein-like n=1 Tax=Leguminivora glycinivorella TaxID=1035111 RepID=UPI00200FFB19|nr:androgen-induced gene 1 protein-like [Leguminivora glycinivorella]
MLLRIFHVSAASLFWYTAWYDQNFINVPFPNKEYAQYALKGRVTFLTFWCLVLQTIYFTLSVLNDYIGTNADQSKHASLLRTIKDTLFVLAFPVALYVTSAFWGIYAVDKDLIFPDWLAKLVPSWVNHTMHTFILLFIALELVITYRRYPSRAVGYSIVILFNLMYTIWFHCIYYQTGVWVYPIYSVLNWPARVGLQLASTSTALGFYVLGEKLNDFVWTKVHNKMVKSN